MSFDKDGMVELRVVGDVGVSHADIEPNPGDFEVA